MIAIPSLLVRKSSRPSIARLVVFLPSVPCFQGPGVLQNANVRINVAEFTEQFRGKLRRALVQCNFRGERSLFNGPPQNSFRKRSFPVGHYEPVGPRNGRSLDSPGSIYLLPRTRLVRRARYNIARKTISITAGSPHLPRKRPRPSNPALIIRKFCRNFALFRERSVKCSAIDFGRNIRTSGFTADASDQMRH